MSQFVRPTILLLRDGTDQSQGRGQIIHNINACQAVVDILSTTLGPRGMDKLIQKGADSRGTTISNDGATIIKTLDIVHPAAKMLTDIATAQDAEVGDGTTTVVLLAGELLKAAKPFIEDGVHVQTIIQGYRRACKVACDKLRSLAVDWSKASEAEFRGMLEKCAGTALNSKLISGEKSFFSKMAVDAILNLDPETLNLDHIGMKRIPGGSMQESQLVKGVAFKKTFSYAGFEQQPKRLEKPSIALLNIELEVKAERANAEIRLDNVEEYQKIVDAEWTLLLDKCQKCVDSGAKVILSCLPIGDVATQFFADRNIFCAGRVAKEDLTRVMLACGGKVLTTVSGIEDADLGTCGLFQEKQVGAERYNFFTDCPDSKTCTILLRGGAEQFIAESERSLHDALMIVKRCFLSREVVGGGGAIEMELSRYVRHYSRSIKDKTQLVTAAFARAFECIPRYLANNAGFDSLNIVLSLRYNHAQGQKWSGVDIEKESVQDTMENFVWEPAANKLNAINAATEAACLILSIDETVKNPKATNAADDKLAPNPYAKPTGPVSIR